MRFDGAMPRRRRPARARGPPTDRPTKKKKKRPAGDRRDAEGGRAFFFSAGAARADFLPRCRPPAGARAQQTEQIIYLFIYLFIYFLFLCRARARAHGADFYFYFYFSIYFPRSSCRAPLSRCDLAWVAALFLVPARRPCWEGPAAGRPGRRRSQIRRDLGRGRGAAAERDGACRGFVRNPKRGMKWYLTCKVAGWIPQI